MGLVRREVDLNENSSRGWDYMNWDSVTVLLLRVKRPTDSCLTGPKVHSMGEGRTMPGSEHLPTLLPGNRELRVT